MKKGVLTLTLTLMGLIGKAFNANILYSCRDVSWNQYSLQVFRPLKWKQEAHLPKRQRAMQM